MSEPPRTQNPSVAWHLWPMPCQRERGAALRPYRVQVSSVRVTRIRLDRLVDSSWGVTSPARLTNFIADAEVCYVVPEMSGAMDARSRPFGRSSVNYLRTGAVGAIGVRSRDDGV